MSGETTQTETPLVGQDVDDLRERWQSIKTAFVDEPLEAVQQADALVSDVIERLTQTFRQTKDSLETQLAEPADVSTEDLRIGLQRYRSFFERLLAA